jgi:O-antigen/teichoic acid export membrane protein
VTLWALSEVARKGGDLRAAYYRLHTPVAAIAYFSAGFLMTSGQALVTVLYDHRYADAGWMLQIVAAMLLTAPFAIATQAYVALGMPQLLSRILAIRLLALLVTMPVGFHFFGLPGALWGGVLSQFSSVPMLIYFNMENGLFDLKRELLHLPATLVGAAAGTMLAWVPR